MASRGVSLRRGGFASVVLSELCVSAYLCERIIVGLTRRAQRARRYASCCYQNSASLRISAREFSGLTRRARRAQRLVSVLVGAVRSLRLCAFCESFSVGLTWRTLRARRFASVVLSELCGSVLSARGSGCRGFRTISEVIDDAFDAVFKY